MQTVVIDCRASAGLRKVAVFIQNRELVSLIISGYSLDAEIKFSENLSWSLFFTEPFHPGLMKDIIILS